jgi:integrase
MKFSLTIQNWQRLSELSRKPSTQLYHAEIRRAILDRWLDHEQEVEDITEEQIAEFIQRIAHFSAPRFNAIVNCLKHVTAAAHSLRTRSVTPKSRHNLSQAQFTVLLAELDARPRSHSGLIVRFLSLTGLRINEARKLRWRDVCADYILAPGHATKNGKARHIPFVRGTAEILERLKSITGNTDFVLPASSVKTALYKSCDRIGIPRLSHHDFRHLFATRCIESGVDLPTAARWLGHQDGGALLGRVYFHLADRHSREMASRVEIKTRFNNHGLIMSFYKKSRK